MFIQYFIEVILSKKCCPNWGVGKKDKKGDGNGGMVVCRRGVQTYCKPWVGLESEENGYSRGMGNMGEEVSDMHRLGDMDGVGNFDGSRYDWGVGDMACF